MEANKSLAFLVLVVFLMGLLSTSEAYDFYVGGGDGWVVNPSESYSNWSSRNRFQVNDKLVFRYNKGVDSVLVVKKEDFDACNGTNPIKKLEGGYSVFQLDRSGPFYFISGGSGLCVKGQKLTVVVLAVRNKKPAQPPTSPSPSLTPSLSPTSKSPMSSPSPSPSSLVSSPSPSSSPSSPVSSPSSSPSPTSSSFPSPAVSPMTPSTAPSSGSNPSSPSGSPTGSPSGSTTGIGSAQAPSPSSSSFPSSSSSVLTVSGVSLGLVALALGGAFLG